MAVVVMAGVAIGLVVLLAYITRHEVSR